MANPLTEEQARQLLAQAHAAAANSISPYSKFPVGAALLSTDGSVTTGCNIESPSILQEICAERLTMFKALSDGHRSFSHMAIATPLKPAIWPCGLCRQMLIEFAPELMVIVEDENGKILQQPVAELLPDAFIEP